MSLLDILAPGALGPFLKRQRHLLDRLVKLGVITLHPDAILRIGPSGSLEVDGLMDADGLVVIGDALFDNDAVPEGDPPLYQAGSGVHTSMVDEWGRELNHTDWMDQKTRDSPFGEGIITALSNLPKMCHMKWKEAAAYLQELPRGKRTHRTILSPLYDAHIFDAADRASVHNLGVALRFSEVIPDEHLDFKYPVAIGRLMGLSLPETRMTYDLWEDHFCGKAYEINVEIADAVTSMFSLIKLMIKHPEAVKNLKPVALARYDFLEERFEAMHSAKEMTELNDFVEDAVAAGYF